MVMVTYAVVIRLRFGMPEWRNRKRPERNERHVRYKAAHSPRTGAETGSATRWRARLVVEWCEAKGVFPVDVLSRMALPDMPRPVDGTAIAAV